MEQENKKTYKSPDNKHIFEFIYESEIRFGPAYYKLQLDGKVISKRIFGFEFKWHPESKYLALEEWLTTSYQKGPITSLTIVDLEKRRFARISKAEKGFIKPLRFEGDLVIFEKVFLAEGKKSEYEINLKDIENWDK
ncbi:hypothetical protein [Marinifilum sp.]|uniref:hypothetical protein n=1 Tax=Marinifilum sp. TaxID=2033137 RepID=UPI003BA957FC